jgi:hypothetical protein
MLCVVDVDAVEVTCKRKAILIKNSIQGSQEAQGGKRDN